MSSPSVLVSSRNNIELAENVCDVEFAGSVKITDSVERASNGERAGSVAGLKHLTALTEAIGLGKCLHMNQEASKTVQILCHLLTPIIRRFLSQNSRVKAVSKYNNFNSQFRKSISAAEDVVIEVQETIMEGQKLCEEVVNSSKDLWFQSFS